MNIGTTGSAAYIPPSQASVERLKELTTAPTFRRPDIMLSPRFDNRLQPRQLVLSYQRSSAIKKLLEDSSGGKLDIAEQLETLATDLRAGVRLTKMLKTGDSLQSSLLYILASELAVNSRSVDSAFTSYVEAEISALLAVKGEEINAAINSAKAFGLSDAAPSDRRWLRAGYLAVVSSQGSIPELLESLLVRFGTCGFQAGALVLLRGLNDDLTSASPSIRPGKLHLILLSSLVSLRHLTAFIHATVSFIKTNKRLVSSVNSPAKAMLNAEDNPMLKKFAGGTSKQDTKDSAHSASDEAMGEEALTVKTFLQLIAGQGSIKLIQRYLEDHFGQHLDRAQNDSIYKEFVMFIQNLPLALWRERGHKDRLLEALRKQLLLDQIDRPAKQ